MKRHSVKTGCNYYGKFLTGLVFSIFSGMMSAVTGCSQAAVPQPGEAIIIEDQPEQIWQVCQRHLKSRGFSLDRVDRRRGLIVTNPLTSRQWFEFWCQDVVTSKEIFEASLHTMRRIIYLEVQPMEKNKCRLVCQARVERVSYVNDIAGGGVSSQIFRGGAGMIPTYTMPPSSTDAQPQWVPLGRDAALEADILRSIQKAVAKISQNNTI